jgi:hypothetical protein
MGARFVSTRAFSSFESRLISERTHAESAPAPAELSSRWSDIGDRSLAVIGYLKNHLSSEDKAYLR